MQIACEVFQNTAIGLSTDVLQLEVIAVEIAVDGGDDFCAGGEALFVERPRGEFGRQQALDVLAADHKEVNDFSCPAHALSEGMRGFLLLHTIAEPVSCEKMRWIFVCA